MAKFYMTKTADHDEKFDGRPFAVNLDCIVLAEPVDDFTMIKLIGDHNDWYCIKEKYEDFIKNLTPYVPFGEIVNDGFSSDWVRKYLSTTKGENIADNNNG